MITYTFKANINFFIFVDTFKTVYNTMNQQITELLSEYNWPIGEHTSIDTSSEEQYWVTDRNWPSLEFFLKVVDIISAHFTDEMIEYLKSNNVVRYIQIVDDQGTVIFPETKLPNIRGQEYTDWINAILVQQQALG